MSSSTSSSEQAHRRSATVWLACFAAVLVILLAALMTANYFYAGRPRVVENTEERQLTAYKIFSPRRFDMVAYGSSRINYGIDPGSMREFLPGSSIYNCALDGGALNREMFEFLDRSRLENDSSGRPRIVLLEISPRVLWNVFRSNGNYHSITSRPPDEIRRLLDYSPNRKLSWYNLFIPMDRDRWNQRRKIERDSIPHCHIDSGWYELENISEDPELGVAKRLRGLAAAPPDDRRYDTSRSLAELLEQTRAWTRRGVLVFGVEPPMDPRLKAAEDRLGNHDARQVRQLFGEAGGIMLAVEGDYPSRIDGSHLDSTEAKRFSREIARKIAAECRRRGIELAPPAERPIRCGFSARRRRPRPSSGA